MLGLLGWETSRQSLCLVSQCHHIWVTARGSRLGCEHGFEYSSLGAQFKYKSLVCLCVSSSWTGKAG